MLDSDWRSKLAAGYLAQLLFGHGRFLGPVSKGLLLLGLMLAVFIYVVTAEKHAPRAVGSGPRDTKASRNSQPPSTNNQEPNREKNTGAPKEQQKAPEKEAECAETNQGKSDCAIALRAARAAERQADIAHNVGWISGFALFFAAVAASAALWTVMVMKRAAMAQLRAYVSIKPGPIEFSGRIPLRVHVVAKNEGQTPAYNVAMFVRYELLPYPLPDNFDFGPEPAGVEATNALAVGDTLPGDRILGRPMGLEIEKQIAAGTHRWYAFGIVRYRDAFGKKRVSRFCASAPGDQMLRGMSQPANVATDLRWEFTLRHNDAT